MLYLRVANKSVGPADGTRYYYSNFIWLFALRILTNIVLQVMCYPDIWRI